MFCEKCGAQLPDNAKFCEKCGSPTAATPDPICEKTESTTAATPNTFCEKCGAQLPEGAKFCEKCGSSTDTAPAPICDTCEASTVSASVAAPICENCGDSTAPAPDTAFETPESTTAATPNLFCEKCGAQLPEGAKFCEKCGNSTVSGAAPAHNVAVAAAAPSAFALAMKKFFSNKRNVVITAIAALLIVALIVVLIILACQPKKIYVDDYFDVVFEGADGYGTAYLDSTDEQMEKLAALNKKLFPNGNASIQGLVSIDIDCGEKQGQLKNGDKVKVILTLRDGAENYIDQKLVLRHKTVKVKGLAPATEVSLLDLLTFVYNGTNKYASIGVSENTVDINSSYKVQFSLSYDDLYAYVYDSENSSIASIYFNLDKYSNLSNGDKITVTIDSDDYDITSLREEHGIIITDTNKEFTVTGLDTAVSFDPLQYITCTFVGYSAKGYMDLSVSESTVSFGTHSASFVNYSSSYSRRFYIDITHTGGYTNTIYYYADEYTDLFNGDTVTFYTNSDIEDIERDYGVLIPKEFTVTVSGLTEPVTPDVANKGKLNIYGFDSYGTMSYDIPEENRVYTIGDYTFKLTAVHEGSGTTVTVVVANSDNENLFVVEYFIADYTHLSNGDTIIFRSLSYSSTLSEYLDEYGIYFPYQVEFTVSGLKELTPVDPLSQVKFTFSPDDDGTFSTEIEFIKDYFTVNDYLAELDLTRNGGYYYIYFKIKDGTLVIASGYYRVPDAGLSNGSSITPYFNMPEYDSVAEKYGLTLNNLPKSIIVG